MSDGEFTIQKDEQEIRAERKRKFDDMIGRAIKARKMTEHLSSGMDMVLSAIFMLKGMMAEDDDVALDESVVKSAKRMLEAARDLTDALIVGKKRRQDEEGDDDGDAEGQTDDVL